MLPAIIGGLLGAGTAVANHFLNRSNLEDTRAYNSPAAQMARLRKAGINPYTQAANGQVDNTLGAVQQDDLSSAASAVEAAADGFTRREQMRINRALTEQQIQLAAERVRGLELDNQYKQATLNDRAAIVTMNLRLSHLDSQIKSGIISKQEYDNRVAEVQAELQEYLSGKSATMFGVPVITDEYGYTGAPLIDDAVAGSRVKMESAGRIHEELQYLLDTHADRVNAQNYRTWREWYAKEYESRTLDERVKLTESQAKYWFNRAIREEIAQQYETDTGLPFYNKDIKTHVISRVISAIGHAWNAGYNQRSGEFSWAKAFREFLREFSSADVPIDRWTQESEKKNKKDGGAGGSF